MKKCAIFVVWFFIVPLALFAEDFPPLEGGCRDNYGHLRWSSRAEELPAEGTWKITHSVHNLDQERNCKITWRTYEINELILDTFIAANDSAEMSNTLSSKPRMTGAELHRAWGNIPGERVEITSVYLHEAAKWLTASTAKIFVPVGMDLKRVNISASAMFHPKDFVEYQVSVDGLTAMEMKELNFSWVAGGFFPELKGHYSVMFPATEYDTLALTAGLFTIRDTRGNVLSQVSLPTFEVPYKK